MSRAYTEEVVVLDAREVWYLGTRVKIHLDGGDTEGRVALLETRPRPGTEPPMHMHEHEDETFIVLEGEVKLIIAGEEFILRPGDSKFAPRRVPHTFQVLTPEAHTFGIITPAGFENFFRTLGEPAENKEQPDPLQFPSRERIGEVAAQFGVRLV